MLKNISQDEVWPVYSVDEPDKYDQLDNIDLPPEFLARYSAAREEWRKCQQILCASLHHH